ncbi:RnfABCDGE type electron transport complex subunit B [Xylophilus rhododendri]|uniref:RnfABCDGE type electron transport complex subunit B n=1 Tax=Xylophilus rhododendri TaxID=2697032 RepID=A0A857JDX8_9BURK|nr:RnfABCDGE type electron transport complex subunit B [Xylophilus rhododendri]QHJ01402.1 RnfABCDGE type electron transport complex subunit B [Xylophilus rhododendri]
MQDSRQALAARLDAALPQTQCTRCGYPDCAAYAHAIAFEAAAVNRCPPGGQEGVARLAAIARTEVLPLDADCGAEAPRQLAVIDPAWCIGCTLCLDACPTDAILGANKRMHTVIDLHCTGCELCVPACPVDCIALENASGERSGWQAWSQQQAETALQRYRLHQARKSPPPPPAAPTEAEGAGDRKRSAVEAALARARARRQP